MKHDNSFYSYLRVSPDEAQVSSLGDESFQGVSRGQSARLIIIIMEVLFSQTVIGIEQSLFTGTISLILLNMSPCPGSSDPASQPGAQPPGQAAHWWP